MAETSNLSLIIDSMKLRTDSMTEKDGILTVPATIAKHMIQDYDGLRVLKPADELEAAARFADGIPITRDHPKAGIVTDRGEILGFLKDPTFENDELSGILKIADKDLAADVKSGDLTDLSIGFFCNLDPTAGAVGDAKYDAVQTGIFLNHVAVVEEGRCSILDGCGFHIDSAKIDSPPDLIGKLDTAIGMATSEWGDNTLKDLLEEIKQMVTASPPAGDSAALGRMTAERDALKADLETIIKTEKDALIAELVAVQDTKKKEDLEKLKLDELTKELDMVRELRTGRLSIQKGEQTTKSAVDAAYDKVGR